MRPAFRQHVDTSDQDLEDAIARFSDRTFHLHLKNIRRSPAAFVWVIPIDRGSTDYLAVLQALHAPPCGTSQESNSAGQGDAILFHKRFRRRSNPAWDQP